MAPSSVTLLEGDQSRHPDLRILHFNDVYHVESGSRDPVGGITRFQTLCNYYRNDAGFRDQPNLITFFSGDAFNPSLESSVTKGRWHYFLVDLSIDESRRAHDTRSERHRCRCSMCRSK